MEIKSKYEIGDAIYFMDAETPRKSIISGITLCVGVNHEVGEFFEPESPLVRYTLHDNVKQVNQSDAYPTKEALIQGVFNKL